MSNCVVRGQSVRWWHTVVQDIVWHILFTQDFVEVFGSLFSCKIIFCIFHFENLCTKDTYCDSVLIFLLILIFYICSWTVLFSVCIGIQYMHIFFTYIFYLENIITFCLIYLWYCSTLVIVLHFI